MSPFWWSFIFTLWLTIVESNKCVFLGGRAAKIEFDCEDVAKATTVGGRRWRESDHQKCEKLIKLLEPTPLKEKCFWDQQEQWCDGYTSLTYNIMPDNNIHNIHDWNTYCEEKAKKVEQNCERIKMRDETGKKKRICKWVLPEPWESIFTKRSIYFKGKKNIDLDALEKWQGMGGDPKHIKWDAPKFFLTATYQNEIKMKIESNKQAYTPGTPLKKGELQKKVDKSKTIQDGVHGFTVYDLATPVGKIQDGWKNIGLLKLESQSCTATMINEEWLISAGHCVVQTDQTAVMKRGITARFPLGEKIKFFAGLNGGAIAEKTIEEIEKNGKYEKPAYDIEAIYLPIGYMLDENGVHNDEYDYCLLKLKKTGNNGNQQPFSVGYAENSDNYWQSTIFGSAGYPWKKGGGIHLYYSPYQFKWTADSVLKLKQKKPFVWRKNGPVYPLIATDLGRKVYGGQSGSPVWAYDEKTKLNIIMGIVRGICSLCEKRRDTRLLTLEKEIAKQNKNIEKCQTMIDHYTNVQKIPKKVAEYTENKKNAEEKINICEKEIQTINKLFTKEKGIDFGAEIVRITPDRYWRIVKTMEEEAKLVPDPDRAITVANKEYLDVDEDDSIGYNAYNNRYRYGYTAYNEYNLMISFLGFLLISLSLLIFGCGSFGIGSIFGFALSKITHAQKVRDQRIV